MKQLKAFKFQLKINAQQATQLRRFGGCCRFVWNKALAMQKERLDNQQGILSYPQELIRWKHEPEINFLKEVHLQPLQQTLKNLDRALREAFNQKSRFPRFKKKGRGASYPQALPNRRVYLPKIGWVCYRKSRSIENLAKNLTLSEYNGRWFVSIQTEQETGQPCHESSSIIGLDIWVAKFATFLDGTLFQPTNSYQKHEKQLKRTQRQLSRKVKFSHNWHDETTTAAYPNSQHSS